MNEYVFVDVSTPQIMADHGLHREHQNRQQLKMA